MYILNSNLRILSLLAVFLFSQPILSADPGINTDANDVAIKGFDTVAFFTQNKAVKGSHKYTATYLNAIYHFANAVNRELFRGNPIKYAPQFGGYCGLGVALQKKFDVDPNAFTIVDKKLYMNVNLAARAKWSKNIPGNIKSANKNWVGLKNRPAEQL